MANDSVVIKISGDIKDYTSKLEAVQKETEDLNKSLGKLGIASAASFALVTAGAVKAVNAFKDSIKPGIQLENILKNQGIFSEKLVKEYGAIATELKKVTGVDDEVITSGQAVIQRFLGQTKVTKELTQAVLDFAAGTGVDTVTAFNLVGKSIGTGTNALSRYGIEIDSNLTAQEKLQVFIANTNAKFRDQAAVLNEASGPLSRLGDAFGNVVEKIGEKFKPVVDGIAGSLENLANAASESDNVGDVVASIGIGVGTLAGAGLILSQLATAFVAVNAAAVALGVSVGVLTGGIGLLAIAVGALGFAVLKSKDDVGSLEDVTKKLTKAQAELIELRKKDVRAFGVGREIALKVREIELLNAQLKKSKEVSDIADQAVKKKEAQQKLDQDELDKAKKLSELAAKRKKESEDELKTIEDKKKATQDLKNTLIDAGKSELQALEDLRDRRLIIAKDDAEARLLVEKDFQEKKLALEKKNIEELQTLRDAEAQFEKERKAKVIDQIATVGNAIGQGKEGARGLVTEGASIGLDAIAPGVGTALKPLLGSLTQGPEATKAFVKEFTDAIPDMIQGLVEALPVLVEELANQTPVIIDRLIDKVPEIVGALVRSAPKIIEAQVKAAPKIIFAIIENIPSLIGSFIDGLTSGAGEFVKALIDAINPFSGDSGVGGFISDVGDFLGFADGGQATVRRVPSGFAGDRFPAFLSSDELVVKPDVARDLEAFLNSGASTSNDSGILLQILEAVKAPMTVQSSLNFNNRTFADIILDLNRSNARLA